MGQSEIHDYMLVLKDICYVVFVPKNCLLLDCGRLVIFDMIEDEDGEAPTRPIEIWFTNK